MNQQERFRIAAEKVRKQKEKEERENREFYQRITSGGSWFFFKIIVVFCSLMVLVSTYEFFVDGPTKKIDENAWHINRDWEYRWHKVLDVEGYMFSPHFNDWSGKIDSTLTLVYTPVFQTGKKLSYELVDETHGVIRSHQEIRNRSVLSWFPLFQIFLLIPLFTYIFKRQSPLFNFARIASLVFVFPGTLLIIYFTML